MCVNCPNTQQEANQKRVLVSELSVNNSSVEASRVDVVDSGSILNSRQGLGCVCGVSR